MDGKGSRGVEGGLGVFRQGSLRRRDVEDACGGAGGSARGQVHGDRCNHGEGQATGRTTGGFESACERRRRGGRRPEADARAVKLMQ